MFYAETQYKLPIDTVNPELYGEIVAGSKRYVHELNKEQEAVRVGSRAPIRYYADISQFALLTLGLSRIEIDNFKQLESNIDTLALQFEGRFSPETQAQLSSLRKQTELVQDDTYSDNVVNDAIPMFDDVIEKA